MKTNYEEIKKAMENQMPEWNKEDLWHDIESRLPVKEKKRRPMLLWFFILSSCGILLAYMLSDKKESDLTHPIVTPAKITKSPSIVLEEVHSISVADASVSQNKTSALEYKYIQTDGNAILTKSSSRLMENKKVLSNEVTTPSFQDHLIPANAGLQIPSTQNPDVVATASLPPTTEINLATNIEKNRVNTPLLALPIIAMQLNSSIEQSLPNTGIVIQRKKDQLWKAMVDGQLGFLTSTLQTSLPEYDNWQRKKQSSNSTKESISFGIVIHKKIIQNLFLGAGIQYLRMNEVVSARDVQKIISEIPSDSAQFVKDGSGIIYLPGTLQQTQTKGYQIYSPNQWTRWSIPLHLSYEIHLGSLIVLPSVSGSFTLYQRFQGIQLHPNGHFIYKDDSVYNTLYKKSGILSLGLGLDAEYPLSPHLRLSTGLFYTSDINSSWKTSFAISEKFTRTGLRIGLNYMW